MTYTEERLIQISEVSGDRRPLLKWHKNQRDRNRRNYLRGPPRVYVMCAGQHVKVGIAVDVDERFRTIRTGNPLVERACYVSAPRRDAKEWESRIHDILKPYRVDGTEWFRCSRYLVIEVVRQVVEQETPAKIGNSDCMTSSAG